MFVFCGLQYVKIFGRRREVLYICSYQVRDKRLVREAPDLEREASQEVSRNKSRSKKPLTEGPADHGPARRGKGARTETRKGDRPEDRPGESRKQSDVLLRVCFERGNRKGPAGNGKARPGSTSHRKAPATREEAL